MVDPVARAVVDSVARAAVAMLDEVALAQTLAVHDANLPELSGDLSQDKGILQVKLVSVPRSSSLGQLKESDSIFEIYTESYGERPIVIQGAGAGAKVTARGVFGDILRLTEKAI